MWVTLDDHVRRTVRSDPWTVTVGLARSIFALATAITLLANGAHDLFPTDPELRGATCQGAASASLFCVAGAGWGRAVGVLVMAAVVSGWRPRWTCLPHWYAAQSVMMTIAPLEGGDQIAAIGTLLLLPNLLTDARRNHWRVPSAGSAGVTRRYLGHTSVPMVRVQVCVVYLHAAVGKMAEAEWQDGTALYYWLSDPVFGVPSWGATATEWVVGTALGVAALTWSTVLVELALALGIVAGPRLRRVLLVLGLGLHGAIAVLLGLMSFAVTMAGALVVYLVRDRDLSDARASAGQALTRVRRELRRLRLGSRPAPGREDA